MTDTKIEQIRTYLDTLINYGGSSLRMEVARKIDALYSQEPQQVVKPDLVEDGFGSAAPAICPTCGLRAVYVCRPGDIRCHVCYDGNPKEWYESQQVVCPMCHGTGKVHVQRGLNDTPATLVIRDCPDCNGTGKVQPETPDELLTDAELAEKLGYLSFTQSFRKELHIVCVAQLAKCHQSEAAKIKELEQEYDEGIKEIGKLNQNNMEVAVEIAREDERKKLIESISRWMNANSNRQVNEGSDKYLRLTVSERQFYKFLSELKSPEGEK